MFVGCIVAISVLKLVLSAIVPASFDLRDIIMLVQSSQAPIGPWIALYPPLYFQPTNTTFLEQWWLTPPPMAGVNLQLISLYFRLPIFILDLAVCCALFFAGKSMKSATAGRAASLLWFANPYVLFGTEFVGVPDVLTTLLVVVSVALLTQRRNLLGTIFLSIGIAMKFYPFLLLPPILFFQHRSTRSWRSMVVTVFLGLLGLGGYFLWTLPNWQLYLTTYTSVAQPFPFIAGQVAINNSAFVLILFYFLLVFFARNTKNLTNLLLVTLLAYYAVSNPAPQYFVWVIPLMALDLVLADRSRILLFVVFCCLAFTNWFFISSAFLTPSGYSLLMIPLGGSDLPAYSITITSLLDNPAIVYEILPFISSALFACILAYAIDIARNLIVRMPGGVLKRDHTIETVPQ